MLIWLQTVRIINTDICFTNCINLRYLSIMQADDQFPYGQSFEWGAKIFLGEGSYGKVFKARSLKDNQFYAIKQMNMEEFNRDQTLMNSLLGQIKITMEVNSEHTVKMIDAKIGKRYTYILLEICDTDLRKQLASKKFTQPEAVQAFQQIMKGFEVLVGKGYIHRDVKPANTLIKNKVYKVADFGFACKADILGRKKITDICGTPIYMAPQLLKNQPYTAKSDIWSLGLMFYEMIFGYPPWPCRSLQEYLYGICNKSLSFPYNAKIGQNTKDFLCRALVVNEDQRMTWAQVFNHPLIKHQQTGANIKQIKVDDYVIKILRKLQEYLLKHQVNWGNYAAKYSKSVIDITVFTKLIRQITPMTTTHEIEVLFEYFDSKKLGTIDWRVLERSLIQVDYRSEDDIFSRKLDQIVAILKDRKIDPQTYFDKIDLNHSGSLDFTQFSNFIASIAPCYTKQQVLQIFKLFDNDKNGLISKKQFLQLISRKFPSIHGVSAHAFQKERAERNLKLLKGYIKFYGMSPQNIVKLADKDNNKTVDVNEFGDLIINRFKFKISKEELQQLFVRINKNQDSNLSLIQFVQAIQ